MAKGREGRDKSHAHGNGEKERLSRDLGMDFMVACHLSCLFPLSDCLEVISSLNELQIKRRRRERACWGDSRRGGQGLKGNPGDRESDKLSSSKEGGSRTDRFCHDSDYEIVNL